jgi:hypothetical protein
VLVFDDEDFLGERAGHGRCREPTRAYEVCQARGGTSARANSVDEARRSDVRWIPAIHESG